MEHARLVAGRRGGDRVPASWRGGGVRCSAVTSWRRREARAYGDVGRGMVVTTSGRHDEGMLPLHDGAVGRELRR